MATKTRIISTARYHGLLLPLAPVPSSRRPWRGPCSWLHEERLPAGIRLRSRHLGVPGNGRSRLVRARTEFCFVAHILDERLWALLLI